jgi:hypothetical protein
LIAELATPVTVVMTTAAVQEVGSRSAVQGVVILPTIECIATVVPPERVVARVTKQLVSALTALDRVGSVVSEHLLVIAARSQDVIVSIPAIDQIDLIPAIKDVLTVRSTQEVDLVSCTEIVVAALAVPDVCVSQVSDFRVVSWAAVPFRRRSIARSSNCWRCD